MHRFLLITAVVTPCVQIIPLQFSTALLLAQNFTLLTQFVLLGTYWYNGLDAKWCPQQAA